MLKTLGAQIKEYKAASIATPIYMTIEVLMETIIPFLMASIIDDGVDKGDMHHIYVVGGLMLVIAVIGVTPVVRNIGRVITVASNRSAAWFRVNSVVQVAMPLVLLLISTMSLVGNSYNPFLYFQF